MNQILYSSKIGRLISYTENDSALMLHLPQAA